MWKNVTVPSCIYVTGATNGDAVQAEAKARVTLPSLMHYENKHNHVTPTYRNIIITCLRILFLSGSFHGGHDKGGGG